jgi:hypothetical protein
MGDHITLDPTKNQIRLLGLKPLQYNRDENLPENDIFCELRLADFSQEKNYIALSYAWHTRGKEETVCIEGRKHTISANLRNALVRLRHQTKFKTLWVDQLCINQANDKEKNWQVQKMKHIYESAEQVVVWTGDASDDSDLVMSTLGTLGTLALTTSLEDLLRDNSCLATIGQQIAKTRRLDQPWAEQEILTRLEPAFEKFCDRHYWKRLWVIQEFAIPHKVLVVCGEQALEAPCFHNGWNVLNRIRNLPGPMQQQNDPLGSYLDDVFKATNSFIDKCQSLKPQNGETNDILKLFNSLMQSLKNDNEPVSSQSYQNKCLSNIARACHSPVRSFVDGLLAARGLYQTGSEQRRSLINIMILNLTLQIDYNHPLTSDSRDRIFSLLGLAMDAPDFHMFPDYSRSTADVYQELARQFYKKGFIDNLALCQFPRQCEGFLPSWAPDWSMSLHIPNSSPIRNNTLNAATGRGTQLRVLFLNNNTLVLLGIFVDTIKSLGARWEPNWLTTLEPTEAVAYIESISALCAQSSRIRFEDHFTDVARIAIADQRGKNLQERAAIHQSWHAAAQCFKRGVKLPISQKLSDNNTPKPDANTLKASDYAIRLRAMYKRRVFISQTGYVGLAPSHVAEGDRIYLFLGGRGAYVLRSAENGNYTVVGDAFVHGIMYGEFMKSNPPIVNVALV